MRNYLVLIMAIVSFGLMSCGNNDRKVVTQTGTSQSIKSEINSDLDAATMEQVREGLPSKVIAQLLTDSQDLGKLEDALNVEGGVNNLDLDGDGEQDQLYIQDTSTDVGKELAIIATFGENDEVNLMSFKMVQNGDSYTVECYPNERYYGSGAYHHSTYHRGNGFITGMMLGYMFSPRYHHYVPRYHRYGYYGGRSYVRHRVVPVSRYRTRSVVSSTRTRANKRYTNKSKRPAYKSSYKAKKSKNSRVKSRTNLKDQKHSTKAVKKGSGKRTKSGFTKGSGKSTNDKAINKKAGNSIQQKSAKRTSLNNQKHSTKSVKRGSGSRKSSSWGSSSRKSSGSSVRKSSGSRSSRSSTRSSSRSSSRKSSSRSSSRSRSSKRSDANFKTQISYIQ